MQSNVAMLWGKYTHGNLRRRARNRALERGMTLVDTMLSIAIVGMLVTISSQSYSEMQCRTKNRINRITISKTCFAIDGAVSNPSCVDKNGSVLYRNTCGKPEDVDGNGKVNWADLDIITNFVNNRSQFIAMGQPAISGLFGFEAANIPIGTAYEMSGMIDVNGDSIISASDAMSVIVCVGDPSCAD